MTTRPTHFVREAGRLASGFAALIVLLACGGSEPVQSVNFKDRINIEISQQWTPGKAGGKQASYTLGDSRDIRLRFEDQTVDLRQPMSVQGVRSAIGGELNMAYGRVDARLSYGGNAVLTYPRTTKRGSRDVYTHNWVVAKPFGYGAVARVAITLEVPEGMQDDPEIQELMAKLDDQVGDAVIPLS